MTAFKFLCSQCGEEHVGSPSVGYKWPYYYEILSESQRSETAKISDDFCSIDNHDFFIRTVAEVPIHGCKEGFLWGVWISVSQENFLKYYENYDSEKYEGEYFGWLSNRLPFYPDTMNIKTKALIKPGGQRPTLILEPTEHPLSIDFQNGITWDKAIEIAKVVMHGKEIGDKKQ